MSTTTQTKCAVLFADVAGSTQLYETLGDEAARLLVGNCLQSLSRVTERHGGRVVKTIGDELMCRFPSADAAVTAARVMQEVTRKMSSAGGVTPSIRAGLHYGSMIEDDGDLFGDAVNLAARMASVARGGQIITTADTIAELSPELQAQARPFDIARVKGKSMEIAIHEIVWDSDENVTRLATQLISRGLSKNRSLQISFGTLDLSIEADDQTISFGRDGRCDVVIDTDLASRQHAQCVQRRGKFVLIDTSTNGTYVRMGDGEEVYLRREELVLQADGAFCLGQPLSEADASLWVRFRCS